MNLNFFQRRSRSDFEIEHRPNGKGRLGGESGDRPGVVAPPGVAATRMREPDGLWPWWLSSPTTSSRVSDWAAKVGQPLPVQPDESDEPTSLPAA
jgi:hypothetical protein